MTTILLFLLVMITSASTIPSISLGQAPKQCIAQRVEKMLTYNCLDLRLKEVPQYMSNGVEVSFPVNSIGVRDANHNP